MGQVRITQYIHRPNKTELGIGNTHECYMLVASDIDMSDIFPPSQDVTIRDAISLKEYILKSSNYREFRINQMGDIYRDYNVLPGDEIIISQVKKEGLSDLNFSVKRFNRVVLLVKKGVAEINNIERLKPYEKGEREYELSIVDRGIVSKLLISFQGAMQKRADSPTKTDYYNVNIDGEKMPNGTYYLTLDGDKNVLANLPKSNFNTIEFDDKTIDSMKAKIKPNKITAPFQLIYYGAPGTGKSYEIDKITKMYGAIRTTFHPDSDYSTFVGAYKPMMEEVDVRIVPVAVAEGIKFDANNGTYKEKRITYKFVKQAFLKAYLSAWKKYAEGDEISVAPQFLVIEEINRGNCAQIFGDLFQLLDRQDNGFSSYPIEADADLQREIAEAFAKEDEYKLPESGLDLQDVVKDYVGNLAEDIKSGKILLLPSNFYIWATMNTSDQSLFPIDSAFKRRWDWHYVKIADAKKGWMIKCGNEACDWWTFVQEINKVVAVETNSDDKKLGYFFCKPNGDEIAISEEKFVGKVMFYLWNDVFKDADTSMFKVTENSGEPSFEDFYATDAKGTTIVDNSALRQFLVNVVGEKEIISDFDNEGESTTTHKGMPRFSLDGSEPKMMLEIVRDLVKNYADNHAEDTAESIVTTINEGCHSMLSKITGSFIVETEENHTERCKNKNEKAVIVDLGNRGKIYVNRYWKGNNREPFIKIAADKGWGNIKQEN